VDNFNARGAYGSVRRQVALGPRPAGSQASRALAERIRRSLPRGRFAAVDGGLRNVIGSVPGRDRRRTVVVGAHYDTKDLPGFVGANDGASGTAILTQLARTLRPRRLRSTVVFIAFDGEESPAGAPDEEFARFGLRGSKAAAPAYRHARAMVLLDFVGEPGLRIPREGLSHAGLWRKLRVAARRVGVGRVFPPRSQGAILDDHVPFIREGVPSIDLIDFDFDCFHRSCDDLSQVSVRSLDAVGETVLELLRHL
jgi:Zn-dependent M28 family amino/carboxypeptidase